MEWRILWNPAWNPAPVAPLDLNLGGFLAGSHLKTF